ncbi:hypothetical protein AB0I77_48575 [Streptomyces sp. NPDC050619]|uniref:hypothetical protein n=1 Tax=Streptomyces sp. NPDC050619 TaxID=3157214 RepID=UPI003412F0C0
MPARPSLAPRRRQRDEDVCKNADTVLLDRETNPHIAFGQCPHYCPGDPPARVELQTVLEALTSRLPGLRLAVPADELTWHRETLVRSLVTLPVTW